MLQCGLYEMDITPPLNSPIPGYTEQRRSQGIRDPLYAKALVIDTAKITVAFVVIDALCILEREARRIRDRIFQTLGIPHEQVMVSATHTHTGPPIRPDADGVYPEDYLTFLVEKAADAVILAYRGRQAARIGTGVGREDSISFNRRYWMKDGTVRTNPGYDNPELVCSAGPIDPDVTVVRIDDYSGRPLGVVTQFACHTDTVGGSEYSGDYPAELSRQLKAVWGEQVISLFLLGTCGDINHCDFTKEKPFGGNVNVRMGTVLAGEVLRIREKIELHEVLNIDCQRTFIPMKLRKPSQLEIDEAQLVLNDPSAISVQHFFADHIRKISVLQDETVHVEIQVFRMHDWAVVGLPGEIFVELGLWLKRSSPFPTTIINTLCNGSVYGYVCTSEAYKQGGYEPKLKTYSRVLPGSGEIWIEKAIELLKME
jgi:hypothetical protein